MGQNVFYTFPRLNAYCASMGLKTALELMFENALLFFSWCLMFNVILLAFFRHVFMPK